MMLRNGFRTGKRWYSLAQLAGPPAPHIPVMAAEVLENLQPRTNGLYVDMTFGAGGHSRQILEAAPGVRIVALDRDEDAHKLAVELSEEFPNQIVPVLGRFSGKKFGKFISIFKKRYSM